MVRIKLTDFIMNEISKKTRGYYSVERLNKIKDTNDFFLDLDYGLIRIEQPEFKNNHVWFHGACWGKKVLDNYDKFGNIFVFVKDKYNVDYMISEIPNDSVSLHKILSEIGFSIDYNLQMVADNNNIMYSICIDDYLRRTGYGIQ